MKNRLGSGMGASSGGARSLVGDEARGGNVAGDPFLPFLYRPAGRPVLVDAPDDPETA